jgi:outer membrane protein TolC
MFLRVRRALTAGLIVMCPCGAWAQQTGLPPAGTTTVDELVARALTANRPLKIATLQAAKAQHDLDAGRTRQFVNFDLQLFEGHLNALAFTFQPGAFGTFPATGPVPPAETKVTNPAAFSTYFSVQASQPLVQLRRVHLGVRQLAAEHTVMEERRRAMEQTIVSNVRRLYYGILETQSAIAASDAGVALARERQRIAGEQVAARAMYDADLAAARADAAAKEQAGLTLRNRLATLRQQMGILVGADLDPGLVFAPAAAPPDGTLDVAAATAAALADRPDIREARLKVRQAEDAVRSKRAEYLPDVSFVARFIGMQNVGILPTNVTAVGIYGTWEPFDWGRKRAEIAANTQVHSQAALALEEAQAQARLDVDTRYRQVMEAKALVPVAELARTAAAERLRLARTRFEAKAVLQSDVLEAEAAMADAEREYQRARSAWLAADAELQRALGKR